MVAMTNEGEAYILQYMMLKVTINALFVTLLCYLDFGCL